MIDNNLIYIKMYDYIKDDVVSVSTEEMVKLMLASQIDIEFHLEAIKTQAIVARTQIIKDSRMFGGKGCSKHEDSDICNDGHCFQLMSKEELRQLWKENFDTNIEKINKAVEETKGLIITINNKPILAKFHDTCGGATENSENVLGNKIVYLRKVLCDYCKDSPNWEGFKDYTIEDIEKKLNVKFKKITPTLKSEIKGFIEDVERDEEGRIKTLKIADKEFEGMELMELLDLDSTRFSISPVTIRFTTSGKGSGLGLCQYGANQMAINGHDFKDIINYYFTGVQVNKVEKPCIKKPLGGKIIVIDPGHGGEESKDFVGENGLREKDVVLTMGLKLKSQLDKLGATAHLTREKDEYISLSKRAEYANSIRPDFFISLHLNSFSNPSIHGCEIYHYRNDKTSKNFSKSIMKSLVDRLGILDRGIKIADFFLLRQVGVSSVQIEVDYITNPDQEKLLSQETYIDKIIHAISEGIVEYYSY